MSDPDPREPYGRLVHETRVAWEADQAAAEGRHRHLLGSWEDRPGIQHELDMRIGSAVAARAVHDAGLVNDRRDAQLFALNANLPAILDALDSRLASMTTEATKRPYRDALTALGYAEAKERSDEKEREP